MNNEKTIYKEKLEAQLKEWKAGLDGLKAKAEVAGADARLKLSDQLKHAEERVKRGEAQLAALADTSDEKFAQLKSEVDGLLGSATAKMKDLVG